MQGDDGDQWTEQGVICVVRKYVTAKRGATTVKLVATAGINPGLRDKKLTITVKVGQTPEDAVREHPRFAQLVSYLAEQLVSETNAEQAAGGDAEQAAPPLPQQHDPEHCQAQLSRETAPLMRDAATWLKRSPIRVSDGADEYSSGGEIGRAHV